MIAELMIVVIGAILGLFGYSWFSRANPSKIWGSVTSLGASGTVYATSFLTGFIVVVRSAVSGGYGMVGYAFVVIWFGAIPMLWIVQGLRGWYHDRPFLASMIE